MDTRWLGLLVVGLGVLVIIVGALIAVGAFNWVGRLPGDIRWESERARVYVPIGSMIVISLILTVLLNIFLRR